VQACCCIPASLSAPTHTHTRCVTQTHTQLSPTHTHTHARTQTPAAWPATAWWTRATSPPRSCLILQPCPAPSWWRVCCPSGAHAGVRHAARGGWRAHACICLVASPTAAAAAAAVRMSAATLGVDAAHCLQAVIACPQNCTCCAAPSRAAHTQQRAPVQPGDGGQLRLQRRAAAPQHGPGVLNLAHNRPGAQRHGEPCPVRVPH
jgi:hypothetical protein